MLVWTDRGAGESLCTGTPSAWWEQAGTAQAIQGALAYASDGVLQLSIADGVVSIAIDGQVRKRVQTPSARTTPSCDGAAWLVLSGIVGRMAAWSGWATVQLLSFGAADTGIYKTRGQYAQHHQ